MNKRRFQRVIRQIRAEWILETDDPKCKFPFGRMTCLQASMGLATVDCGGERKSAEYTLELAQRVMNDDRFLACLEKDSADACIEKYFPIIGKAAYHVRIRCREKRTQ